MNIQITKIPGVLVLKPRQFPDPRGYFVETYSERVFRQAGIVVDLVQDNQSVSIHRGTIRALHFQLPPATQAKLVRVVRGSIYDVVVDLRRDSPAYGQWMSHQLSAETGEQIFIPRGLAHGLCTLEPNTEVAYKVDDYYAPACESGIVWNDPTLKIPWPVAVSEAILSDKDRKLGMFKDFVSPFQYSQHASA